MPPGTVRWTRRLKIGIARPIPPDVSLNSLVSLGRLGAGRSGQELPTESEAAVFRRMLGDALAMVAETIEADEAAPPDVTSAINMCRAGVATGLDATALDPLATACFKSMRRFSALTRGRATAQRAQVTALVAMVREAVATIAGSQTSMHDTLTSSADSFDRIARINNIQEIQARLAAEVKTLKRIAIEKREAWEQTFQDFGKRLTGLESQLDSTRREATIDPLTNVANRRMFDGTCRTWMGPNQPPFVLAMIDVDDFKAINDRHGHDIGDRVLVTLAATLTHSLRPEDLVARLGGDEFAVLAAPLTLQQAHERFTSMVNAVSANCQTFVPEGTATSISIGIAEFSAGDTAESLQKRADLALYDAKRLGKGRVVVKASPFIRDLVKGRQARK